MSRSARDVCVNSSDVSNVSDEQIVLHKEDNVYYCFDLVDVINEIIKTDNFINPITKKILPQSFIDNIRSRYEFGMSPRVKRKVTFGAEVPQVSRRSKIFSMQASHKDMRQDMLVENAGRGNLNVIKHVLERLSEKNIKKINWIEIVTAAASGGHLDIIKFAEQYINDVNWWDRIKSNAFKALLNNPTNLKEIDKYDQIIEYADSKITLKKPLHLDKLNLIKLIPYDDPNFFSDVLIKIYEKHKDITCIVPASPVIEDFLIIWHCEDYWLKCYLEIDHDANKLIDDCLKTDKRFFFGEIMIRYDRNNSHANAFVIDNVNKTFERFEPHGSSKHFYKKLMNINEAELDETLEVFSISKGLRYISPTLLCPNVGMQRRENLEHQSQFVKGFCQMWSLWYIDKRLDNPDIDGKELQDKMIQEINADEGKSFLEFIIDYTQDIAKRIKNRGHELTTIFDLKDY